MRRREKFIVILESILSVDSSADISLRNKMRMNSSFFRELFILEVNEKWMNERLSHFTMEEMMKMKSSFHTLFRACVSLFNDKTLEIRRNVWRFLGVMFEHLLGMDSSYPIKTLQFFLPNEITDFIHTLKEGLFSIDLSEHANEEVFAESLGMFMKLFSSLTTKFSKNSFVEIFLLERSKEDIEKNERKEELTDMFPKVNKFVQFFHIGWTSMKNSNYIIQHFLNVLNTQQIHEGTYHHAILPTYIRMTNDYNLRNLRFRYHITFQNFIEDERKEAEKLFTKESSAGVFSYFFSSKYSKSVQDLEESNSSNTSLLKRIPFLVSFLNVFFVDPKFLSICVSNPNVNQKEDLIVEKSEGTKVKLKSTLLGNFFSLCSIVCSVRTNPKRQKRLDRLKLVLSETCLHALFILGSLLLPFDEERRRRRSVDDETIEEVEYTLHSITLFREDARSNKLRSEHHGSINLVNLIVRVCEQYILNYTKESDQEAFKFSLRLLQYLFRIVIRMERRERQEEGEHTRSKIVKRKVNMDFLRVWEVLVGKLISKKKNLEMRTSILLIIETCILEGDYFLHTEDQISLIYELVRRDEEIGRVFQCDDSKLIRLIGLCSVKMVESGPHSLGVWKKFIQYEVMKKIEEWKNQSNIFKERSAKEEVVSVNKLVQNLQHCICRLLSSSDIHEM